jgi:transposase-like protein
MNTHKNARLTFARRLEMVQDMTDRGLCATQAAARHGVTPPTARKWLGRYLADGASGLADASSRPKHSPRSISPATALLIVELRRKCLLQSRIAQQVGVSGATVSRVLARAGLSKLSDLQPREPVQRYEHEQPGDLLHIDIKKLGRIERPSHRVTGNRRDSVEGAGWEYLFVAVDDHARIAFTGMQPNERQESAVQFLRDAVAYYGKLGVTIKRLLTDNGSAFRSKAFRAACAQLGIAQKFTRAYRPQTFLDCFICGSRSPAAFLVKLGVAMKVASTTVPGRPEAFGLQLGTNNFQRCADSARAAPADGGTTCRSWIRRAPTRDPDQFR